MFTNLFFIPIGVVEFIVAAPLFPGVLGGSGKTFLFKVDFLAKDEITFFLFDLFGVGFFLDFLTSFLASLMN